MSGPSHEPDHDAWLISGYDTEEREAGEWFADAVDEIVDDRKMSYKDQAKALIEVSEDYLAFLENPKKWRRCDEED